MVYNSIMISFCIMIHDRESGDTTDQSSLYYNRCSGLGAVAHRLAVAFPLDASPPAPAATVERPIAAVARSVDGGEKTAEPAG